jgi:hypothetical protein
VDADSQTAAGQHCQQVDVPSQNAAEAQAPPDLQDGEVDVIEGEADVLYLVLE